MKNSAIQWTDHTFNPWIGCTKVSPGCANCYAATQDKFRKWTPEGWGAGKLRKRTSAHNWNEPRRWNREAEKAFLSLAHSTGAGIPIPFERPRVFCASLADWLDEEVPAAWLADLMHLIWETPHLDWLLLTKRPENFTRRMEAAYLAQPGATGHSLMMALWNSAQPRAPKNVWIGTTVEDQQRADERIPQLLRIPARVRFLSCEPLLGPLDLAYTCFNGSDSFGRMPGIHWVICGGESGPGARPFHSEHAWDLLLQCRKAGVAPFVKQLGANPVTSNANAMEWPETTQFHEIEGGSEAAGASVALVDKKGGDMAEWPEELRVQEFPQVVF